MNVRKRRAILRKAIGALRERELRRLFEWSENGWPLFVGVGSRFFFFNAKGDP